MPEHLINNAEPAASSDEISLSRLIDTLSAPDIQNASAADLAAFEALLSREYRKRAVPHGDFYTPEAVARLMARLLEPHGGQIYDPCCGSGALLVAAARELSAEKQEASFYGQTLTKDTLKLCIANLCLRGLRGKFCNLGANTLIDDQFPFKKFDYILSNPPFNCSDRAENRWRFDDPRWVYGPPPRSNANLAWLQHVVYHLSSGGRAAVVMPNSSLTSGDHLELQIRSGMVEDGVVEAIITFPKKLFCKTEIPFCLWLLRKESVPGKNVLFIDAARLEPKIQRALLPAHTERISALLAEHRREARPCREYAHAAVSNEDIARNKYMLSPNLYLKSAFRLSFKSDPAQLAKSIQALQASGISDRLALELEQWKAPCIPAQWSRQELLELYDTLTGVMKSKSAFGRGLPMLDTKTVIKNHFVPEICTARVEVSDEESRRYGVRAGDVFLNRTSESPDMLAQCCVAARDRRGVFGGYLKRLRPKYEDEIYPCYAAGYFRSAIFRKELADVSTVYTTRASLNNDHLSRVAVYYPEPAVQRRLGDTLYALFLEIEACTNAEQLKALEQLRSDLIELCITRPIAQSFNMEGVHYE